MLSNLGALSNDELYQTPTGTWTGIERKGALLQALAFMESDDIKLVSLCKIIW